MNDYLFTFSDQIRQALKEDLGDAGDVTSQAIIATDRIAEATLVSRQAGRVCGLQTALSAFQILDPEVIIDFCVMDGADVVAGDTLATLRGNACGLLAAERTALNLLAHLCGIATVTNHAVVQIKDYAADVVCTRKTTPGLRALEKYAVRVGGGKNHRFGLYDAILIKDNHLLLAGSVTKAVERVREHVGHMVKVEVEVDTLSQLEQALAVGVDIVLLDNMSLADLGRAVDLAYGKAITEASGNITLQNIRDIAACGVNLISVGWLTHSAAALDVGLDFS